MQLETGWFGLSQMFAAKLFVGGSESKIKENIICSVLPFSSINLCISVPNILRNCIKSRPKDEKTKKTKKTKKDENTKVRNQKLQQGNMTKRPKKAKRKKKQHKDKNLKKDKRQKGEFDIVMSGQFCTLGMFFVTL